MAQQLGELTRYDAAVLAVARHNPFGPCPFWTTDRALFQHAQDVFAGVRRLDAFAERR